MREPEFRSHGQSRHDRPHLTWFWDAMRGLPFLLALLVAGEKEARAYTDPGSGALVWQMVAAGFVGVLFYVRKFTMWFKRKKKDSQD
jgi:hypothetical protein